MSLDTRPAALDKSGGTDSFAGFRVTSSSDMAALLRELRDSGVPVILNGADGTSYTTVLWSFDSAGGRLSFSADDQHLQPARLVEGNEVTAVAYLDNVKLQFDLQRLVFVRGAQSCALQGAMPQAMYRFQRRGSYRVKTADRHGLSVGLRHPAIPDMALALRILDVSIGGCALLLPADVPLLQAGTRLQRVHVDLDPDTRFDAGMLVHHVASQGTNGAHRLGCEWVQMDGSAQRSLQRYIDQTQKRRRLLTLSF
ncbi:MAG: flagellar brake protein [Rubrivivax sp.]|nr:flagellar brake protein [Rubrivivax sp.]